MQQKSYRTARLSSSGSSGLLDELDRALEDLKGAIQTRSASGSLATLELAGARRRAGIAWKEFCSRLGIGMTIGAAEDCASCMAGLAASCMAATAPAPETFPRDIHAAKNALRDAGIDASDRTIDDFMRLLVVVGDRLGTTTRGRMDSNQ